MRQVLTLAAALAAATFGMAAPAAAKSFGCNQFMDAYGAAAGEHRVQFSRALTVGRGEGAGYDYFDASGDGDVDVSLVCRGDRFVRLEVRAAGGSARAAGKFERLQQAGLQVALGMDRNRAASTIRSLDAEARDYLRASNERGDVYVAGKVERHMPGGVDLGMLATDTDRTLIIVAGQ